MAIALVTSQSSVFGASGGTTGNNTTTGATLIVVCLSYQQSAGANLSDSKGNTWTRLTLYEGSGSQAGVVFYYCSSPTVGTSHTFTTTSHFCGLNMFAFSGTRTATTPKDQENGQFVASLSSSVTPGSITPTADGCVLLTTVMNYNGTAPTLPTSYTGFTYTTSTAFAGGAGYLIQTTATAANPSWTGMTVGNNGACNVVSFFAPAAAATGNSNFFAFF